MDLGTFAEVRPKARSLPISTGRVMNFIKLTCVDDIDDRIRGWLTEAYNAAASEDD